MYSTWTLDIDFPCCLIIIVISSRHRLSSCFPRISLLFSFISSKECLIGNFLPVEDLWSSPAPGQLPATPYKPSAGTLNTKYLVSPLPLSRCCFCQKLDISSRNRYSRATGREKSGQFFCLLLINLSVYVLMREAHIQEILSA